MNPRPATILCPSPSTSANFPKRCVALSMPATPPDMDSQPANSRGRVLFADDDQGARDSLLLMLRRLGYNCESAATAEQALTLLRAAPAEVLLSDIHMPG